jgi:hypothetical protein
MDDYSLRTFSPSMMMPIAEHLSLAGAMAAGYAQAQPINEAGRTAWLNVDFNP